MPGIIPNDFGITAYQLDPAFPLRINGFYPFPMLDETFELTTTAFEENNREQMMLATSGAGFGGYAVMPTIAQRVGDEAPFRSAPPINEDDASQANICTKCGKWVPLSDMTVCEGRVYCRRHARVWKYKRGV